MGRIGISVSDEGDEEPLSLLGPETLKYLNERASDSFKRQNDLEESIWRSLPIFTGGLIADGAIIKDVGSSAPPMAFDVYAILTYGACGLSIVAFGAATFALYKVARARTHEVPASDHKVTLYARDMTVFYSQDEQDDSKVDQAVLREMRAYVTKSLSSAASSSSTHNVGKLKWRWRLLNALVASFVFAFLCKGIILLHTGWAAVPATGAQVNGSTHHQGSRSGSEDNKTVAATDAGLHGRGVDQQSRQNSGQGGKIDERQKAGAECVSQNGAAPGSANGEAHQNGIRQQHQGSGVAGQTDKKVSATILSAGQNRQPC